MSEPTQLNLRGEPRTTLVNQKRTDRWTVDIGRANNGENTIRNTEPGEPGWLGNPFAVSDGWSREAAVARYREEFRDRLEDDEFREAVEELRGETLACYCKPKACHGDVILEYLRTGDVTEKERENDGEPDA